MNDDELREYIAGLNPGERVIETAQTCFRGKKGTVYISDQPGASFGSKCVLWDGPEKMGTGVTAGTRRLEENPPNGFRAVMVDDVGCRGPIVEFDAASGKWRLPDPPVVMASDVRRIKGMLSARAPLTPVDAALVMRVLEINSENS